VICEIGLSLILTLETLSTTRERDGMLVVRAEAPHFSFGGEARGWPGKDVN
jgi:hypothetical protein